MSSTNSGAVFERGDAASNAGDFTKKIAVNGDADKRGTPSGIKSGDVEKGGR